jgi:hypothetical protein
MLERKRIAQDGIPDAMEKALRYRLLNESLEAESICGDVLDVEPDNGQALVTMLLALTDQFATEISQPLARAKELLPRLADEYDREYYRGIINERWANAQMGRSVPNDVVYSWFREALACYERAMVLAPLGDPDATLRWNTCVHLLDLNPDIRPGTDSLNRDVAADFGDDMPMR